MVTSNKRLIKMTKERNSYPRLKRRIKSRSLDEFD